MIMTWTTLECEKCHQTTRVCIIVYFLVPCSWMCKCGHKNNDPYNNHGDGTSETSLSRLAREAKNETKANA
jgi:CDGSH-type Zn-finger protein